MNKIRQKELVSWLKQQCKPAKKSFRWLLVLGIINGIVIISQAWLLSFILHNIIVDNSDKIQLIPYFRLLLFTVLCKALLVWLKEKISFSCGAVVRQQVRQAVLSRLQNYGPIWIQGKPAGSWTTMIFEQIEEIQDYYSRYLPQIMTTMIMPTMITIAIFPKNWAAALILILTAPLIPFFMIMVGMGAADANRRNFSALSRLSGNFLDRLRGLDTLRLFYRRQYETESIHQASEKFRIRTMDVLKLAFLSSAVLEFFASISIAVVAVYFGFSYLGEFNFGHYGSPISLFIGFFCLILAPEFFQPLRDLGTFYHAKAQATGAAETLFTFLDKTLPQPQLMNSSGYTFAETDNHFTIVATNLIIQSRDGKTLAGPLNFTLQAGQRIAIVGYSGAGKSSLFNVLLGFLPYSGSLTVNGIELYAINSQQWRQFVSWIGQTPHLPENTIRNNILLANPTTNDRQLKQIIKQTAIDEFIDKLPDGLDTKIGDSAARLSVGQAQRVALARALLQPCRLLLLDEPTASLDEVSEHFIMQALQQATFNQLTLFITHKLEQTIDYDEIWVMVNGKIVQTGHYSALANVSGAFNSMLIGQEDKI